MDEREMIDKMYQLWAKTDDPFNRDWCEAIHEAFPEIVRQINSAWDEADRADHGKDERECRIAELELALAEELASVTALQSEVEQLKDDLEGLIAG